MAETAVCSSSCNTCQFCDAGCEGCDACMSTCDACQSYCEIGMQSIPEFGFGQCISAGQTMITKKHWDVFIEILNFYRNAGNLQNASSWTIVDNNEFLTAEKFNEVSRGLNHGVLAAQGTELRKVEAGEPIYGSYFQELESLSINLKYNPSQCNICNIGCEGCDACEGGCDGPCQICNICEGCNAQAPSCGV